MKLTIASGVLVQTLAAVSEEYSNPIPQGQKSNHLNFLFSSDPFGESHGLSRTRVSGKRGYHRNPTKVFSTRPTQGTTGLLMNPRTRQDDSKYCDPSSNNPDIGILSCGRARTCIPSEDTLLGGRCEPKQGYENAEWNSGGTFDTFGNGHILEKIRKTVPTMSGLETPQECNPTTGIPDVGILSCGDDQVCVPSDTSSMGGYCSPLGASSRRLHEDWNQNFPVCDPTWEYYAIYGCDCTGFDNTTGNGKIPCKAFENFCLGLVFPGCKDVCETRTLNFTLTNFSIVPYYSVCFIFTAPYAQKFCFEENFEEQVCTTTFDDEPCASCEVVLNGNYTHLSFDCTNVGGMAATTEKSRYNFIPIVQECYTIPNNTECTICTEENTVFDLNSFDTPITVAGIGNLTCYDLYSNEYLHGPIGDVYCPAAAAAGTASCCVFSCSLCGSDSYIPDENYGIELDINIAGYEGVTCGDIAAAAYVNHTIDEETCPSASSVVQPICCVVSQLDDTGSEGGEGNELTTVPGPSPGADPELETETPSGGGVSVIPLFNSLLLTLGFFLHWALKL